MMIPKIDPKVCSNSNRVRGSTGKPKKFAPDRLGTFPFPTPEGALLSVPRFLETPIHLNKT